jgi:hypothetical protein
MITPSDRKTKKQRARKKREKQAGAELCKAYFKRKTEEENARGKLRGNLEFGSAQTSLF